jgi:hypothetical protein
MAFTFRLERLDGTPAYPPSFRTDAPGGNPATRSHWARAERFRSFASATTTPTSRSLRSVAQPSRCSNPRPTKSIQIASIALRTPKTMPAATR